MEFFEPKTTPDVNVRELLRYAGAKGDTTLDSLISDVISEADELLSYRVIYLTLPVVIEGDTVKLGALSTSSGDLRKNLLGCSRAIIFGATVGSGIDRLITKYGRLSPSRALLLQAYGSERIESLCDCFCAFLTEKTGKTLRPRFSCGYGDLPLDFQRDVFALLDCKRIGLTLNESLSMSPSKSVTAIVGLN